MSHLRRTTAILADSDTFDHETAVSFVSSAERARRRIWAVMAADIALILQYPPPLDLTVPFVLFSFDQLKFGAVARFFHH